MIAYMYLLAALVYSTYAAIPYLNIDAKYHYPVGVCLSIIAGISWITISRGIAKEQIPLYSAYFDLLLTTCFIIIPILFVGYTFNFKQSIGLILFFISILLIKT
jgi:membrane protease YdiL (CAAX protease family)